MPFDINPETGWSRKMLMWRRDNSGTDWDDSKYDEDTYNTVYGTTWFQRTWWYTYNSSGTDGPNNGYNKWARKYVNLSGAPRRLQSLTFKAAPGHSGTLSTVGNGPSGIQQYNAGGWFFTACGYGCEFTVDLYIRNTYEDIHVQAASTGVVETIDMTNCIAMDTNNAELDVMGKTNLDSNTTKFGREAYYGPNAFGGQYAYDSQGRPRYVHDITFTFADMPQIDENAYMFVQICPINSSWPSGSSGDNSLLVIQSKDSDFNAETSEASTAPIWRYSGTQWERVARPLRYVEGVWEVQK